MTLEQIENAIIINCGANKKADRRLSMVLYSGPIKNTGVPRSIFIAIAQAQGYSQKEIRDYLDISLEEYRSKATNLRFLYITGEELFRTNCRDYNNLALFYYRKLRLTTNYIHRVYGIDLLIKFNE